MRRRYGGRHGVPVPARRCAAATTTWAALILALHWCGGCGTAVPERRLVEGGRTVLGIAEYSDSDRTTPISQNAPPLPSPPTVLSSLLLSQPSSSLSLVTQNISATPTSKWEIVPSGDSADGCAARICIDPSVCDFKNRQTVNWAYVAGDNTSNCSTPHQGQIFIDCDHVGWDSGEGIAIVMLAAFGMAVSLCFWLAIFRYKKSRTIRSGQPTFCSAFVTGIGITCVSAVALVGKNTDSSCALRLWLWSMGFDLAFGALALKQWRTLHNMESSMRFRRVKLSAKKVKGFLAALIVADMSILAWWTARFGGRHCKEEYDTDSGVSIPRVVCVTCCDALFFIWVGFKALLVLLCCYMSFRTRKIQNHMAESGAIAMATYNLLVAGLLVAAVLWSGANPQVRTTAEAVAIVLAGVGTLWTILAPKLLCAKHELESKALVGPSAVANSSSCECEVFITATITATEAGPPCEEVEAGDGGEDGGTSSVENFPKKLERLEPHRRRKLKRQQQWEEQRAVAKNTVGGIDDVMVTGSSHGHNIPSAAAVEVLRGSSISDLGSSPVSLSGTTDSNYTAGYRRRGRRGQRGGQQQPKPPPVLWSDRQTVSSGGGGAMSVKSAPSGGGFYNNSDFAPFGGGGGDVNLATNGRLLGKAPSDPSVFLTPPRSSCRSRSISSGGGRSSRSVDGMALAAAAAGAAAAAKEKRFLAGGGSQCGQGESAGGGGSGKDGGGGAGGNSGEPRGERTSSTSSLSGFAGDRRSNSYTGSLVGVGGGGGGSGSVGSKPPLSGASGSSRTSSRGRTSTRSTKNTRSVKSSGGSEDAWSVEPLMAAINGYGWNGPVGSNLAGNGGGGGVGNSNSNAGNSSATKRKSSGSAGRKSLERLSGSLRKGLSRERGTSKERGMFRERSLSGGSLSALGRRSSAAGSLVMHGDTGTLLHCPHCDKEVAGCGFKGCSGSLIRAPSVSDDELGLDLGPPSLPHPPPLLPPLVPSTGLSSQIGGGGGGGGGMPSSGGGSGMRCGPPGGSGGLVSPTRSNSQHSNKPSSRRLRMSFRSGRSACDTFDNEADSDEDDDDDSYEDVEEDMRSGLGVSSSPHSSSAAMWGFGTDM